MFVALFEMSLRLRSATLLQSASGFGLLLYSQSFLCNLLSHCRIEFQPPMWWTCGNNAAVCEN
ncbi:hypothetical protein JHK85_022088 [Glycine max]|nr:hypothetical protein JHK85_022088 [Glycine max]KHN26804.1 hypothetical protein glysoja_011396 [Glycine soja]